jgi:peptidoglycan/xylan/chitin deacetylase (PgdA/CDA1 family)
MSLKDSAKQSSALLMQLALRGRRRGRVVILCYHSVHPAKAFANATPKLFERQLAHFRESFDVASFSSVAPAHCEDPSGISVSVTFDDGYEDNYSHAFPLLLKYGFPASFFLTTGLVEQDSLVLKRFQTLRRSSLEDVRPLSWSQIDEMRSAGMEFGAHTHTHPNLARLPSRAVAEELRRSRQTLEDRFGEPVTSMAYPFGKPRRHFTEKTLESVDRAGYDRAAAAIFRSVRVTDSFLALPRFFVAKDDISTIEKKVRGFWDHIGWWQENAPLWLARRVSAPDFDV